MKFSSGDIVYDNEGGGNETIVGSVTYNSRWYYVLMSENGETRDADAHSVECFYTKVGETA